MDDVVPALPAPAADDATPSALAGGLQQLLMGSDAETELVRALVSYRLRLTGRALRAATFLYAYGLGNELNVILALRRHLASSKELVAALDAVALKKFMGRLEVKLGGS